jgi:hypothetical protein
MSADPNAWREQRPTPSQRLHEVTMAALNKVPSPPESSVTVSRNARGVFQFEVTVRGYDVDECWGLCWPLIKTMTEIYPYPEPEQGE